MIEVPKLVFILLIGFLVWYAMRWMNGTVPKAPRRRPPPSPGQQQRQASIEDLVACPACGAYIAASMRACGKPGCRSPAEPQ